MDNKDVKELKELLAIQHEGDVKQLEVIFSEATRLIVEAPAGYGKTTTMISRLAYLLAEERVTNPKKILALTFSVNSALKIKRDTSDKLPKLMKVENNPVSLSEKITATNYHGFCKSILSKYGYLLDANLRRNINTFKAVGDDKIDCVEGVKTIIQLEEVYICKKIEEKIKSGLMPGEEEIERYINIVCNKLLPINVVTHNAELLLTIDLFRKYPEIKKFYQNYYTFIIVDEFQDTNVVAWELIKLLINKKTNLLFLGDPLQRIYGFIGALPNIMEDAKKEYGMTKIVLDKNYRFRSNFEMLKLDYNTRQNALHFMKKMEVTDMAKLPGFWGGDQEDEANQVVCAVKSIISLKNKDKVAILTRSRGENASIIEIALQNKNINYFYGMFTDEDEDYISFHNACQDLFLKKFGKKQTINNLQLKKFAQEIRQKYEGISEKSIYSLLELLDALCQKVAIDYAMLSPEDKYLLLIDIFENRQLKQSMEYVDCDVILATIHGAKGLEWDYVFLTDLEQWVFPGYSVCINCDSKNHSGPKCSYLNETNQILEKRIIEELSVFYVGITRARKQVYVSASAKRPNGKEGRYSCFSSMNGINLVKAQF